ncbi:GTP-binding protein, HflX [Wolffia australiana]
MFKAASRLQSPLLRSITIHGAPSSGSSEVLSRSIRDHSKSSSSLFVIPCRGFSSKRKSAREEDNGDDLFLVSNKDPDSPPRLFVVQPRIRPDTLLQSKLSEALNLANSLEQQRDGFYAEEFSEKKVPMHVVVQNPLIRSSRAHADTFFGPGTVDNVKAHIKGSESKEELDAVFVNTILSGVQQRNLETAWEKPVLDRVGLIIEIFNAHAQTKEAKLQSELAALMYMKTRLVRIRGPGGRLSFGVSGEAQVVSARGRASGGQGFISGAGESELHLQRRRIQERRLYLLAQIEEVRRTRALQRSSRKRHGGSDGRGLSTVAIVGYTNAGKSTLVSALSHSDVFSDDRLFATVDPRLRSVILPSGRKVLLSDTVGFISDLPVQLVEAFHATLEEVVEADLLVHVMDSSAKNLDEQRSTVLQVLHQIGVAPQKIEDMIEVLNKIDLVEGEGHLDESKFYEDEAEAEARDVDDDDVDEEVHEGDDVDEEVHEGDGVDEEWGDDDDEELEFCESLSDHATAKENAHPDDTCEEAYFDERAGEKFQECISTEEDSQPIKTSALLGVGLQELLQLIDDKLDFNNSFHERDNPGPFDRKWRPRDSKRQEDS